MVFFGVDHPESITNGSGSNVEFSGKQGRQGCGESAFAASIDTCYADL
jgi:hypothetical protein